MDTGNRFPGGKQPECVEVVNCRTMSKELPQDLNPCHFFGILDFFEPEYHGLIIYSLHVFKSVCLLDKCM